MPAKIQVTFYSMYGHVYQMAEAVAAGARDAGAEVSLWQVPELVPDEILEKSGAHAARAAFAHVPVANPTQLAEGDAIIFGTPITGGTPYGATTLAGIDGSRQPPSENELAIARFQGRHVAQITNALIAGRKAIG